MPENAKDIGKAMEKGDLRENAEYKAALEKQDLLNSAAAKIQSEMQESQIFDESQTNVKNVTFGTKVMLHNIGSDESEEYTILGPWESDPSKNIISYLSPFGTKLFNRKKGEELKFTINKTSYHYKVEEIETASLSQA